MPQYAPVIRGEDETNPYLIQRDTSNPGPPGAPPGAYAQNTTQSMYWAITWNNAPIQSETNIEWLYLHNHVSYIIAGEESAPTTGTDHLQIYAVFNTRKRLVGVRSLFGNAVYATPKYAHTTSKQNIDYCKKNKNKFVEFGTPPDEADKRDMTSAWETFNKLASERKYEEIKHQFPSMYTRYHSTMLRIGESSKANLENELVDLPTACGVWVWGPPGTGKSTTIRNAYPNAYRKNITKWWDGYNYESDVIIDDIADYRTMLPLLKIWADQGWFMAEKKGATMKARPRSIIITANVSMEDAFPDPVQLAAIKKRFIDVTFDRYRKFTEEEMKEIIGNRKTPAEIMEARYVANDYKPTEYGQLQDYQEPPEIQRGHDDEFKGDTNPLIALWGNLNGDDIQHDAADNDAPVNNTPESPPNEPVIIGRKRTRTESTTTTADIAAPHRREETYGETIARIEDEEHEDEVQALVDAHMEDTRQILRDREIDEDHLGLQEILADFHRQQLEQPAIRDTGRMLVERDRRLQEIEDRGEAARLLRFIQFRSNVRDQQEIGRRRARLGSEEDARMLPPDDNETDDNENDDNDI